MILTTCLSSGYKGVNEPLSYTTHTFRDQRGGVQPRECQLQVCHWGQVLDEKEGPPHPLGVSEHQSHCTSYPQQPMGRSRGRESEGQHKGLLYNTVNKPTTIMHSPSKPLLLHFTTLPSTLQLTLFTSFTSSPNC